MASWPSWKGPPRARREGARLGKPSFRGIPRPGRNALAGGVSSRLVCRPHPGPAAESRGPGSDMQAEVELPHASPIRFPPFPAPCRHLRRRRCPGGLAA
ncbi:protein of unknown function [Rhodovastum atsumiense]|nr:protein of unknown function [Rhodovastum atsumiense]